MTTQENTPSDPQRKVKEKKKGKSILKGCLITLVILVLMIGIAGGIGWSFLTKEHREAATLPLNKVDFDRLSDGKYHGIYAGGMYKWRYNECDVTVIKGKVTDINLTASIDPGNENTNA